MEKINKVISLEQIKTRYPFTYPSLEDGEICFVNSENLITYKNGNYGFIPLGVSEDICGLYRNFTIEMGILYEGKVLDYYTLHKWYKQFEERNNICIYNQCGRIYSSATSYYDSLDINDKSEYMYYLQMDRDYKNHGGERFYKWLSENYFISVDLYSAYVDARKAGLELDKTYEEWHQLVYNMPFEKLYYPDAVELLEKMKYLSSLYADISCKDSDNCCDCAEFKELGGKDMCTILGYKLEKLSEHILETNTLVSVYKDKLIPSLEINLSLKKKTENLGSFEVFSSEFIPGKDYKVGDVCTYQGKVYILMKEPASILNEITGDYEINFGTEFSPAWRSYYDYYKALNPDEFKEFEAGYVLKGRTSSSLDEFLRSTPTVDNIGNILPGYYEPPFGENDSHFIQPPENSFLDLPYEIGKTAREQYVKPNEYFGDVLMNVNFYYVDGNGAMIPGTYLSCKQGDDLLSAIENVTIRGLEMPTADLSKIHADFVYYKGTSYKYKTGDGNIELNRTRKNGHDYIYGIKCTEHCTLTQSLTSYHLSSDEAYTVKYYQINRDIETFESDVYQEEIEVNMCDFELNPFVYDENDTIASPLIHREETLGMTEIEKPTNNIYIDRGYATALDKHLRIGEISSLEALEQYGNGSFNLINNQEQVL